MAINKRKVLEAAQKFLQKGALDKALKEYQSLVQADPRDSGSRLKLGDIHLKLGQKDEAVTAYVKVAEQFMKDGFDAKAVALYKQILKIDAHRADVHVPLAELYQRLGLTTEAMGALQTAADSYHREGKKREALDLLRKMATLDPTNTTSRIKIAELLRQAGLAEESLAEYEEVAGELARNNESEQLVSVYERMLELDGTRVATMVALARTLVQAGALDRAEVWAQRAAEARPEETPGFELLAEILRARGRDEALQPIYRKLVDLYRGRGEDEKAREIVQCYLAPGGGLELGSNDSGFSAARGGILDDDEVLDDHPAPRRRQAPQTVPTFVTAADGGPDPNADDDATFFESAAPMQQPPSTPVPTEVDLEQLLAEASVYLRYGKHDKAIECLDGVLAREPENRVALEKLGEIFVARGETPRAVESWSRAAALAREQGDASSSARIEERIVSIDPQAAAAFAPASAPVMDAGATQFIPRDSVGAEAPAQHEPDLEIDLDPSLLDEAELPSLEGEESAAAEADRGAAGVTVAIAQDAGEEEDLGLTGAARLLPDATPEGVARPAAPDSGAESSSTTPQQIVEDLEEGEFYFQQSLFDEAEAVYRRVLQSAPNHPQALLRLGEIEAGRGQVPAAPQPTPTLDLDTSLPDLEDVGAQAPTPDVPDVSDEGMSDLELDLGSDEPASDPTPDGDTTGPADDTAPSESESLVDLRAELAAEMAPPPPVEPPPVEDTPPGTADFDLAAELSEALAGDEAATPGGAASMDDGFDAVFREFKRGVQRIVAEGDHDTHYDLGIAYREMGLLDDAIEEFRKALTSPARRLECLHMLGLCALDSKRPPDAVAHLEQALALPDVPAEKFTAVRFDLGRAYQEQGDVVRALAAFQAVGDADPDFPNLAEHLVEVERRLEEAADAAAAEVTGPGADEADGAGTTHDTVPIVAETFESFDDLIAEAEMGPVHEPPSPDDTTAVGVALGAMQEEVLLDTPAPPEDDPAPLEEPPTPAEEQPAFTEEQPVAAEEPPAFAEEQPVAAEEQPVAAEEPPAFAEEQPVAAEEPPAFAEEQPVAAEEQPVAAEADPGPPQDVPAPVEAGVDDDSERAGTTGAETPAPPAPEPSAEAPSEPAPTAPARGRKRKISFL